jgi:hypothetical protein
VTNGIPLGCSLLLPVDTVNPVQTLKVYELPWPTTASAAGSVDVRALATKLHAKTQLGTGKYELICSDPGWAGRQMNVIDGHARAAHPCTMDSAAQPCTMDSGM